ncbi:MAG: hypothetical protein HY900_13630 [Deltaproteobacteria bacterium]|nr:hypothetical protein [Deltaproteobacteria bacterium]
MHPEQVKALRAMTPAQKLEVAQRLYWSAREFKEAAIRQLHRDWTEEQVKEEARKAFLNVRD